MTPGVESVDEPKRNVMELTVAQPGALAAVITPMKVRRLHDSAPMAMKATMMHRTTV